MTNPPAPPTYPLSLHDALPIFTDLLQNLGLAGFHLHEQRQDVQDIEQFGRVFGQPVIGLNVAKLGRRTPVANDRRSEEHTSELQSLRHPVCRLLLETKTVP